MTKKVLVHSNPDVGNLISIFFFKENKVAYGFEH